MTAPRAPLPTALLLDWGDTVMRTFPGAVGPMASWPRVAVVPGMVAALRALRGRARLALATNAADSTSDEIRLALRRVRLDRLFDEILLGRELGARKPSRAFFDAALDRLALPPDRVVMVGGHFAADVEGANGAGIRAIWLAWRSREERSGPLHATVHAPRELGPRLEAWGLLGPPPDVTT